MPIVPPSPSTTFRAIARPRPEPVRLVVKNGSKIRRDRRPRCRSRDRSHGSSAARVTAVRPRLGSGRPPAATGRARTACCALLRTLTSTARNRSASVTSGAPLQDRRPPRPAHHRRPVGRGVGGVAADLHEIGGRAIESESACAKSSTSVMTRFSRATSSSMLAAASATFVAGCRRRSPHGRLDDHQRVPDLVRDDGREPSERRQPLALAGFALEPVERVGELAERRRRAAARPHRPTDSAPVASARQVAGGRHLAHRRGQGAQRARHRPRDAVAEYRRHENRRRARSSAICQRSGGRKLRCSVRDRRTMATGSSASPVAPSGCTRPTYS